MFTTCLNLECKHETAFWGRTAIGTFEKQAPGLEHPKVTREYLGTSPGGSDPAGTPLIANIRQKNIKP